MCVTYIAVGQRYGHDVLCIDLQRADSLARTSVFRLDGKLCDEPVDAAREEPGHHDKGVVLSKCRQVGHKSRGWKERGFEESHTKTQAGAAIGDVVHHYPPDSAVFIYKDLLKAPTPAEDIAATCRTEILLQSLGQAMLKRTTAST